MDAIVAAAELVGLAIYRLFPRAVQRYVEYDSMLGHILVLCVGGAAIVGIALLLAAVV